MVGHLRLGPIHHGHRHIAGGVDIQRQLDLLELMLSLACDLRSAGLSVRTSLVSFHMLVDLATSLRVRQHHDIYQCSQDFNNKVVPVVIETRVKAGRFRIWDAASASCCKLRFSKHALARPLASFLSWL